MAISPDAIGLIVAGIGFPSGVALMKLIPSKKSQPEPTNGNAPVTKAVCLAVHAGLDKRLDKTDETLIRVEKKLDRVFEHIATHRGARDDD